MMTLEQKVDAILESQKMINKRIDALNPKSRFISRKEIIEIHKETWYNNAVRGGHLTPIKQGGKTATVIFEREEYLQYIEYLKR
jgi:hypothetical protein